MDDSRDDSRTGARPVIVVTGATGAQGGGLVRAILSDARKVFAVRAVTRDPRSEQAAALERAGAELVAADFDDAASLVHAFRGAQGAYCVTNFWEHFSPEKETVHANNLATAAQGAGVEHVIWSTLEDTRLKVPLSDTRMPTLMGSYKVPHFDAKGAANRAFIDRGVPTTFLLTSFYWENLIYLGAGPQKDAHGTLAMTLPLDDAKLPGIARDDIGRCAFGIFKGGAQWIGKTVGIAGEHLTGPEMAAALTAALGKTVRYNAISPDDYRSLDFPGAEDLGNMYQYQRDFNAEFCAARDPQQARSLNPSLQTFTAWLAANKQHIPL